MSSPETDIVITGAGPAGCVMALQLAVHSPDPARIVLRGSFEETAPLKGPAVRTLALNQGSCALLEGLPTGLAPGADIHVVHVSQRNRLGRTLIESDALDVPRLGRVVAYAELLEFLRKAVKHSGITLQERAHIQESSAQQIEAAHALHIVSDGLRPSHLSREYDQHGVLAVVRATRPRPQWAFERFTREGPLALLPHPDGSELYSLVWCCPPQQAQARHDAEPSVFNADLQAQFGDRLGRLELVSPRMVAPLSLHLGPQWVGGRRIVIGNAAQTLHPVAGQGLNLALRDVAQLAQALRPWLHQPYSDPTAYLAEYQKGRQADRWLTVGITDFLPRIFTTAQPLIEHACGLGLLGMDLAGSLRAPLSRHLLQGLRG